MLVEVFDLREEDNMLHADLTIIHPDPPDETGFVMDVVTRVFRDFEDRYYRPRKILSGIIEDLAREKIYIATIPRNTRFYEYRDKWSECGTYDLFIDKGSPVRTIYLVWRNYLTRGIIPRQYYVNGYRLNFGSYINMYVDVISVDHRLTDTLPRYQLTRGEKQLAYDKEKLAIRVAKQHTPSNYIRAMKIVYGIQGEGKKKTKMAKSRPRSLRPGRRKVVGSG
ncbi:MAG: hypothetical protein F7B59_08340 [Desulfurococcales archaeon]|nr:hypothetical protein [Desulfurococcales archaeon]